MARNTTNKAKTPTTYKFICIDLDGNAYAGATPEEAFRKFEEESCYSGEGIEKVRFFELGKEFIGKEEVVLTEVKHGA